MSWDNDSVIQLIEAYNVQSTWFALPHLEFLLDRNKPRAVRLNTENEAGKNTEGNDTVDKEHFEDSAECESHESESLASGSQKPGAQASGGQESTTQPPGSQESATQASGVQTPRTRPNSTFKSPASKKQNKRPPPNDPIMHESLKLMRASSQAATSAASAVSTHSADRYQIYANYLASKFRTYLQTTFLTVEHRINQILYCADSGQYECVSGYGGYQSTPNNNHTPMQPPTNRKWEGEHGGYQSSNSDTPIPPNQVETNESDSRDTDDFSDLIRFNL
ncbi:unnamed protein product [Acanthoscelides obtectus]|uniref:Uncharacterized protein n=1 Tax=Acanthoscelides obtectus TaxID=200917 RepID=A0A9P0JUJ7_ACAOB|nr:unnamed protein product [Acanthoscelides obtectus]CAK1640810.1 hypothetical protein AOBTE_LOCUS11942 [Acanthoscelides obtectus]